MKARRGVTMLELIVVLAIMGVMAGFVGLAIAKTDPGPQPNTLASAQAAIADARMRAIRRGAPVDIAVSITGNVSEQPATTTSTRVLHAVAFPDGSVIADRALGIDRLTGRPLRLIRRNPS
jgi:prepilin-type N-terminal cleavage/methylation domain-containing protein